MWHFVFASLYIQNQRMFTKNNDSANILECENMETNERGNVKSYCIPSLSVKMVGSRLALTGLYPFSSKAVNSCSPG